MTHALHPSVSGIWMHYRLVSRRGRPFGRSDRKMDGTRTQFMVPSRTPKSPTNALSSGAIVERSDAKDAKFRGLTTRTGI